MSRDEVISKIEYVCLYVVIGLLLLFQYSRAFTEEELFLFVELMMTYVWTAGLLIYAKLQFNLHLFEPIVIISAIYEGIFVLKPIVDLRAGTMVEHGVSVIEGGPKATMLFALGYSLFFFSYYLNHKKVSIGNKENTRRKKLLQFQTKYLSLLYATWCMAYVLCVVCMLSQGLSLRYIFSFGAEGTRSVDERNTALLFLSNFGITLITLWLMILEFSPSKAMKVFVTVLCAVYILMRNARWLMLVFIGAPIVLYYLKQDREPRLLYAVLAGVGGLAVFAWMQANRNTLSAGGAMQGWGKGGFTMEKLLAPLESDLSTYRTFYAMVLRYPSKYDYMMGASFLYAAVLFIPRAIWHGKPDNPVRNLIERSLNKRARLSGTAVANIGEFYGNFGVVGVFVFMYLIGWIAAAIKRTIFDASGRIKDLDDRRVLYAILYPLLFQWIARGNFSGNFYLTVFAFLPALFLRKKEDR